MPLVTSNQYQLTPNTSGAIAQGYNLGQTIRSNFNAQQAQNRQLGQQQAQQQFLGSGGLEQPNALQEAGKLGLDFQNQVAKSLGLIDQRTGQVDEQRLFKAAKFALQTERLQGPRQDAFIQQQANQLEQEGDIAGANKVRELLVLPPEQRNRSLKAIQVAALSPEQIGRVIMQGQGGGQAKSASQVEYETALATVQDPNASDTAVKAAEIKLGLKPRAVGSAVQTITDKGTAGDIALTEEEIARGKETGKSKAQLKYKPQIESAVTLAKKEAAEKGEVLTDLARMQAAKPGLDQAVSELRELSSIASSTIGEKIFDAATKELGFGATKGSTARAKFRAIIDNQVLPLLKPTFGAAFTVSEGDALRATLGDPDSSPAEKMAQLEAFIAQKERDIATKQAQLNQGQSQAQPVTMQAIDDATGEPVTFTLVNGQWVRR